MKRLILAALLAVGVSGVAVASNDDWIMLHCSGDEYILADNQLKAKSINLKIKRDGTRMSFDGRAFPRSKDHGNQRWDFRDKEDLWRFNPQTMVLSVDHYLGGKQLPIKKIACQPIENPFTK